MFRSEFLKLRGESFRVYDKVRVVPPRFSHPLRAMLSCRQTSGRPEVYLLLILFTRFALSALQNVTIDDATSTGEVVPHYIPASQWNIGNECESCRVKPDPSLAYDGTWHDTTFGPGNGNPLSSIEFNFTGSALYIYFIIANNVTNATTLTSVNFVLDYTNVTSYTHNPENTTAFEYNVLAYANDSFGFGPHTMTISAANIGQNVLILFDYFIYTTNASSSGSSSPAPQGTSSNPAAIIGGAVGGAAAVVLVVVSLLCYRRYRKRNGPSSERDEAAVDPFVVSREVPVPSSLGTTSPLNPTGSSFQPGPRSKFGTPSANPPSEVSTATPVASSSAPSASSSTGTDNALLQQVGMLRNEVARLRDAQNADRRTIVSHSEAPPEYS